MIFRRFTTNLAIRVIVAYSTVSVLWLVITNLILAQLTRNPDHLILWAGIRGLVLAVIGSILIFILVRQGETELQNQLNLLQAVIEGTTDAIFVKDLQGRYILANSATASAVGIPLSAVVGSNDYQLFPDDADTITERDRQIMAASTTVMVEEVVRLQGQTVIYSSTKYALRDKVGRVRGLVGVSRDVTATKQLERDRLQLLQELQQQNRSLNALNAVTENAISTLELNSLLKTLLTRLVNIHPGSGRGDFFATQSRFRRAFSGRRLDRQLG